MGKLGLIPHHHCDVTSRGEVVIRLIQMQYINDINGLIILKKKKTLIISLLYPQFISHSPIDFYHVKIPRVFLVIYAPSSSRASSRSLSLGSFFSGSASRRFLGSRKTAVSCILRRFLGTRLGCKSWDSQRWLVVGWKTYGLIWSGWWLKNHLEKWWSSSMGRMTSHIWNGKEKMFETTNQILHLRFSGMMIYDDIKKKNRSWCHRLRWILRTHDMIWVCPKLG